MSISSFKDDSRRFKRKFQGCLKGIKGSFKSVSRKSQGNLNCVSRKGIQLRLKGISSSFQGFKDI